MLLNFPPVPFWAAHQAVLSCISWEARFLWLSSLGLLHFKMILPALKSCLYIPVCISCWRFWVSVYLLGHIRNKKLRFCLGLELMLSFYLDILLNLMYSLERVDKPHLSRGGLGLGSTQRTGSAIPRPPGRCSSSQHKTPNNMTQYHSSKSFTKAIPFAFLFRMQTFLGAIFISCWRTQYPLYVVTSRQYYWLFISSLTM